MKYKPIALVNVVVGDWVVRSASNRLELCQVTKITRTTTGTYNETWDRKTGRRKPQIRFDNSRIVAVTDELVKEVEAHDAQKTLLDIGSNLRDPHKNAALSALAITRFIKLAKRIGIIP